MRRVCYFIFEYIELSLPQSLNGVEIANSDGWDTYRSDRVVIQDSIIKNTDGVYNALSPSSRDLKCA